MSNLIINIRVGLYHFQVERGFRTFRISRNESHAGYPDGFFQIHQFFNTIP